MKAPPPPVNELRYCLLRRKADQGAKASLTCQEQAEHTQASRTRERRPQRPARRSVTWSPPGTPGFGAVPPRRTAPADGPAAATRQIAKVPPSPRGIELAEPSTTPPSHGDCRPRFDGPSVQTAARLPFTQRFAVRSRHGASALPDLSLITRTPNAPPNGANASTHPRQGFSRAPGPCAARPFDGRHRTGFTRTLSSAAISVPTAPPQTPTEFPATDAPKGQQPSHPPTLRTGDPTTP